MRRAVLFVLLLSFGLFCWNAAAAGIPGFFVRDGRDGRFVTRTPELAASFFKREIVLSLRGGKVRLRFAGSNRSSAPEAAEALPGHVNFLLGRDPAAWKTDVPIYGSVAYRQLYPGIDMTYSHTSGRLKSEFVVAPGADPGIIQMRYEGMHARLDSEGTLLLSGPAGELREQAPVLYQQVGTLRVPVSGGFRIHDDGSVGFRTDAYDRSQPLVIDPVLTSSSYLGGNGQNSLTGVAVDASGNMYVAGWTDALNLPVANPFHSQSGGSVDAFVAKLGPGGNSLLYCTYLGGSGDDRAFAIAVDPAGSAYVTGWTGSSNFPTAHAMQANRGGGRDAFVAKLTPAGNALSYSTFLGGSSNESGNGIAVDSGGNAYVTGDTASPNFPTASPYQSRIAGIQNAFVAKLNASGSLGYATYLGGSGSDHAAGIAIDSTGNAYVTGSTTSSNFPTFAALQPVNAGGQDAFIAKLGPAGNTLIYGTYLGGRGGMAGAPEGGQAIAVDASGSAYVAGVTSSVNFPVTAGALQSFHAGGGQDAFVAKLNPAGSALVYATYLGGSSFDFANGIAVDFVGHAYVAGYTGSTDFLTARPLQDGNAGLYDAFLAKLNPAGTALVFSTYLGGSGIDSANAIAADSLGNAYVAGQSLSPDFPLLHPAQATTAGYTGFIAKISSGWKVAVFNAGAWYIDQNRNGIFDGISAGDGAPFFGQAGDIPVTGDWDGSGISKIGVFRAGQWLLDVNGNGLWDGPSGGDRLLNFGQAGDLPVVGDWNGSGTAKIGIYRSGFWMLDYNGNGQWDNTAGGDVSFWLGNGQYLPIVGDWNGSGTAKAGVFY